MRSMIRYMAQHRVAANLLMVLLMAGGAIAATAITVEVFPEVDLDRVIVTVAYPGAGPAEVEEGIVQPIEEAITGLDGVRQVQANAEEGMGTVLAEAFESTDIATLTQDVKAAVDRIVTFPKEAERPIVRKLITRRVVLKVVIYGEQSQRTLRQQAEQVRDGLLALKGITQAELSGLPNYEISVEVSEGKLRAYHLTLDMVAKIIRASSLDLPGGTLKTRGGEILLRTKERRYTARQYENIVVISNPDGSLVRLGDIAEVRDTFEDTDEHAIYDGKPAAMIDVYRVGDETPTSVSKTVADYLELRRSQLPKTLGLAIVNDRSKILESRLDLLLRNAFLGLLLVILVLGLFLELKLAFWVTLGIPISVLGAMLFMLPTNVTINMISLFAFILVLGIVVDDAIVVGENIHIHRLMNKSPLDAATEGAIEVGIPVIFAVLTTVAAFAPLLFVSGIMGKFMGAIPIIVIAVLTVSLIESLFVLPSHLTHERHQRKSQVRRGPIAAVQRRVNGGLNWFIERPYSRLLRLALRYRYTTLALAIVSLLLTVGLIRGGHVKMTFLPQLEGDRIQANLIMPFGTPAAVTEKHINRLIAAAQQAAHEFDAKQGRGKGKKGGSIVEGIFGKVGGKVGRSGPVDAGGTSGGHLGGATVFLKEYDKRGGLSSAAFAARWRKLVGMIPGARQLDIEAKMVHMGAPVGIKLAHDNFAVLRAASQRLKQRLEQYPGLYDIGDSYEEGKRELKLKLLPAARALGITSESLARQVRAAFYGAEALRLQRGRNEIKVMVRYPERQRSSLANVDDLRIRAPDGSELPFAQAASIEAGRGYARIERTDRKRTVVVQSKADPKRANPAEVIAELKATLLPQLVHDYPGLTYDLEGEQRERRESLGSLAIGFLAALGMIFALLAIPFRSYSQPLLIMVAIPFGLIGAVLGHLLLGYSLSLMSMFGVVALTGVVVNDSLVLIDFINRKRQEGELSVTESVYEACRRRFRPILLTTLTTFFALVPMLAERSVQARFLIPMAISLAFGVLVATAITLVLIPALYVVLEDVKKTAGRLLFSREEAASPDDDTGEPTRPPAHARSGPPEPEHGGPH